MVREITPSFPCLFTPPVNNWPVNLLEPFRCLCQQTVAALEAPGGKSIFVKGTENITCATTTTEECRLEASAKPKPAEDRV